MVSVFPSAWKSTADYSVLVFAEALGLMPKIFPKENGPNDNPPLPFMEEVTFLNMELVVVIERVGWYTAIKPDTME